MNVPVLKLKAGKEANVTHLHPWIFSGAFEDKIDSDLHGKIVQVADRKGDILATGTCSTSSSIAVRVFAMGQVELDRAWFAAQFRRADSARQLEGFGPDTDTTGYRVVFGESDGIPGLVVDRYEDVLVIQVSTAGMDALKPIVVEALKDVFTPTAIVERSDLGVRKEENLPEFSGILLGAIDGPISFMEHGLKFEADVVNGQKTGFFLDQKELRNQLRTLSKGKSMLNIFSYTGAAGVYAMDGGATSVHNIDSSKDALTQCGVNAKLNGIKAKEFTTEEADAFQFLGKKDAEATYDIVVMDPPALIKSQKDAEEGKMAYHFLNRAAMRLVKDGGIFVTSSCSRFLMEDDLAFILRRASVQNKLVIDVLGIVRQAADHPQSVYFPEAVYLKSFICRVRKA